MILRADNFTGQDVRVSFQVENEAERHQLNVFKQRLESQHAFVYTWNDSLDGGGKGIGVVVKLQLQQ